MNAMSSQIAGNSSLFASQLRRTNYDENIQARFVVWITEILNKKCQ